MPSPSSKAEKARILLVFDLCDWILGRWARSIHALFGDEFAFVRASLYLYQGNERIFADLVDRVDAVHLLLPHPFDQFRPLARDQAFITTIHHWVEWGGIYQRAIKGSDRIVTGAASWKERLVERGVRADRITVTRHGVEDRYFTAGVPLLPRTDRLSVGFFAKKSSNEQDRKGTRHFRRLVEHVCGNGMQGLFRFVIAGPGWEEEADTIRAWGGEVVYLNFVEDTDMPALFQSLDVYLMLSDVEGGPATVAEAMASGCLVLSTPVGVVPEIMADRETGILVNSADVPAITAELARVARHREAYGPMIERARRAAQADLRLATTFAPLRDLYREVTAQRAPRPPLDTDAINAAIAHLSPAPR